MSGVMEETRDQCRNTRNLMELEWYVLEKVDYFLKNPGRTASLMKCNLCHVSSSRSWMRHNPLSYLLGKLKSGECLSPDV